MKTYLAMVADRHRDPEAHPFSTPEAAIDFARAYAHGHATRPEDVVEEQVDGWLYHARCSVEEDSVWVVARDLDALPEVPA